MIAAASWLCLLAPLAGALLITLARHADLAHASPAWISTLSVFVGFAGAVVAFVKVVGREPRRPRAPLDRLHVVRRQARVRRVQGADADPRRPDLADDDADHHRRRRPDRLVLDGLHEGRGRGAPLLRLHGLLRLLDADARDGRQPAAAARRLGPRRPRLVPADRLLPRPARGGGGGQEGVHHERDRRRRDGARRSSCSSPRPARSTSRRPFYAASTGQLSSSTVNLVALGLLGGAVAKSAQLPLHTWLPDAMEGPTPVSALIHAATMVTAGVYLIVRTHSIFEAAPNVQHLSAIIGGVTLLVAGRDRARAVGHQARDRVLDDVADRLHVPRGRDRRLRLRDVPPDDARLLQGAALPLGRRDHPPPRRRAGHPPDGRPAQGDAVHPRGVPRRHARARRASRRSRASGRRTGSSPRRSPTAARSGTRSSSSRLARRAPDGRLHVPALLPRLPRARRRDLVLDALRRRTSTARARDGARRARPRRGAAARC